MTARAEAQTMRLACLYALGDSSAIVSRPHLIAALEVWRYCFASAVTLFGDRIGDPVADQILSHLRRIDPESATRTEISELFNRHKPASEMDRGLRVLAECQLAKVEKDRTSDGRPTERWHFAGEISEISEISPAGGGDVRLIRLFRRPREHDDASVI